MYGYVFMYVHVCIHVHMVICIHKCFHRPFMSVCLIHIRVYVHINAYTYTCLQAFKPTYAQTPMRVCESSNPHVKPTQTRPRPCASPASAYPRPTYAHASRARTRIWYSGYLVLAVLLGVADADVELRQVDLALGTPWSLLLADCDHDGALLLLLEGLVGLVGLVWLGLVGLVRLVGLVGLARLRGGDGDDGQAPVGVGRGGGENGNAIRMVEILSLISSVTLSSILSKLHAKCLFFHATNNCNDGNSKQGKLSE